MRGKYSLSWFVASNGFAPFVRKFCCKKKLLSGKFWVFAPLPPAPSTKKKLSEGRQEGPSLINFHSHRLHYWVCVGAHWCYLRAGTDRTTGLRRGLYPRPNEPFLRRCYRRPPRMRNSGRGGRTCFLRAGRAVLCASLLPGFEGVVAGGGRWVPPTHPGHGQCPRNQEPNWSWTSWS